VVDADIRAYFDNIPHGPLMADIGRYIADGRVLELIGSFLKQDVLEDMALWTPEKAALRELWSVPARQSLSPSCRCGYGGGGI